MPANSYRSPSVMAFAAQLRRSPTRLRLRQLQNIEFLLSIVEADKSYPFDFVCHAVTGYRPRAADAGSLDDSPLIDGEDLRGDLVTLAEDISESADIGIDCAADVFHSAAELAQRFDVSTKTIFRWRRRGLVGWRLRFADRRVRLAFPERCVRRFVAENLDLVQRGSTFSQLSRAEREQIVAAARAQVAAGQKTVNAVARAIAGQTGRAVETIRLILKHYDEAHPRAGIFNRSELHAAVDDQRISIWEAYVDGASVRQLAQKFDKPVAWIYRAITEMRARSLKASKIEYIHNADFEAPDAPRTILQAAELQPGTSHKPVAHRRVPADLPPYLRQLFDIPLLTAEGEVALFRKMNYLKFRADQLRQSLDPETASASDLDAIDSLLADSQQVKNEIIQSNLRLVVSIAKRHASRTQDFFATISDGNIALMRAIDKFDYGRGFKFSTYASWAIMRSYARTIPDEHHQRDRFQTGREELLLSLRGEPLPEEVENEFQPIARSALDRMLRTLDRREREILRQRFGIDSGGEPQTLAQIGESFGVSKERIRQLEARAMSKLRTEFADEAAALFGANS